jgi:hypothetical protein
VAGCYEYGDEPSGSCTMELVKTPAHKLRVTVQRYVSSVYSRYYGYIYK